MPFWQLTVPISPDTADGFTNFLWEQGALGVVEEESPGRLPCLRAFFAVSAPSAALLAAVRTYRASLSSLGFAAAPAEPEMAPLLDEAWASAWQQAFPPRPVGRRLVILPPWEQKPDLESPERVRVTIEPGRAFGTGHHGSSAGCLELLEEALELLGAPPVLDIGTGTGILAIAAVKLGAPDVLAIDVDPDAVAAAQLNAERNGCADRIRIALGGPEGLTLGARFPLVLANLLAQTHLALRPQYERLTARGGLLALGGILEGEDDGVVEGLGPSGFTLRTRLVTEGWASLLLAAPRP